MSVDTLIVHYLRSSFAKFHVAIVIPSSTVAFLSCNRTFGPSCISSGTVKQDILVAAKFGGFQLLPNFVAGNFGGSVYLQYVTVY